MINYTIIKTKDCIFCKIEIDNKLAQIVYKDDLTLAFMDLRQFHPGHTLIIPRKHFNDIRELNLKTGNALMHTLSKITQAVSDCFPNNGISIWHSIGPAAFQEVPHLHIHVHPRHYNDEFLKVYPKDPPKNTAVSILEEFAEKIRRNLC